MIKTILVYMIPPTMAIFLTWAGLEAWANGNQTQVNRIAVSICVVMGMSYMVEYTINRILLQTKGRIQEWLEE